MEALHFHFEKDRGSFSPTSQERLLLPHLPLQFDKPSSSNRLEIERYITEQFFASYQAKVNTFLPYLLSTSANEKLTAVMGFQPAGEEAPLFLEQYLDSSSIESTISTKLNRIISRDSIVEVGNLTSSRKGTSQILFILTIAILHHAGFEWVTFTATKQVQKLLNKLQLVTIELAEADPSYLTDKGESWGSYYQNKPKILAGDLGNAMRQIEQHRVIKFILKNYQNTIMDIAKEISGS